jgi:DNA primase
MKKPVAKKAARKKPAAPKKTARQSTAKPAPRKARRKRATPKPAAKKSARRPAARKPAGQKSVTPKRATSSRTARQRAAPKKRAARRELPGEDKRRGTRSYSLPEPEISGLGADTGGQSGDIEGLRQLATADSQSVRELLEEGQSFEAGVISGVENAPNADESEVTTREVPEDDVPREYLDQ